MTDEQTNGLASQVYNYVTTVMGIDYVSFIHKYLSTEYYNINVKTNIYIYKKVTHKCGNSSASQVKTECVNNNKFPLTPMGVLALGSAQACPSARPPINMNRNFPPHVSAESPLNTSPNPSEVIL